MRMKYVAALAALSASIAGCSMTPPEIPERDSLHAPTAIHEIAPHELPFVVVPTTETPSLDRAIRIALRNNPSLQADYARIEGMMLEVPQVSSLEDPMVMVSQRETIRGPGDERENMVLFSQSFPWFGKRELRGRIARSEGFQALEDYRASALEVRQAVTRAWHMLHFQQANRELLLQEQQLLSDTEDAVLALYQSAASDRATYLRAQTESAMIETMLRETDAAIEAARRELERLMAARLPKGELAPGAVTTQEFSSDDLPALYDAAMTYRPELAAIHESHARAALQEKLARAEYNPDFTLGLGVQGMGMRNSEFYQPNSDERTDSLQASISMNIPIPNARRRAAVAQAQKRAEEMQLREDSLTDQIMESIAANVAQITSLREQITLYENSILPLAEESFLAADASYRSAKGNYIDLLDAQRTLLTARREQLRINRDHDLAVADLERAIALPLGLIARAKESLQ